MLTGLLPTITGYYPDAKSLKQVKDEVDAAANAAAAGQQGRVMTAAPSMPPPAAAAAAAERKADEALLSK